jgi:aminomethyltransferase
VTSELQRTPLFDLHLQLGARMVPFAGWEMPIQYAGLKREHQRVREAVGLFDVSHMGELEIHGSDAVPAVNRLITNDLERATNGQAIYTCCCNADGMILDDLIVYRIDDARVLVVCNASNRDKIRAHFEKELKGVTLRDRSDELALLAVQGPRAKALLDETLGPQVVGSLKPFHTHECEVEVGAAPLSLRVARTGYTGEDGVEIFCAAGAAAQLAKGLVEAGAEPCGLAARDTLRLEAALSLYGNDIDETTHPLEARLGWTVKFDKADFVGKSALERLRDTGSSRKLVGFEMVERGIARAGYALLDSEGRPCGRCTSGSPSPTLGKNIGLGYLPIELSKLGTQFAVDCRGKTVAARVVKTPFYRRSRTD